MDSSFSLPCNTVQLPGHTYMAPIIKSVQVLWAARGLPSSTLAAAYASIWKTSEAEQLLVRALSIREKGIGVNHPDVALNGLR
jgi:hypothetical protein